MSAQAGPGVPEDVSRRAASRSATTTTTAASTCSIGNNGGAPVLLKNNAGEGNHWVGVKLQGTACNRDAIGATITWSVDGDDRSRLKTNGGSYLSSHDLREVLGLGTAAKVGLGRDQVAAAERPRRAAHRRPRRPLRHHRRRQGLELEPRARACTFAGLFLVTLSTLTYQLLLTRTFSVTMSYHFAFVAISVTMFGMAAGAVAVFLRPAVFERARANRHLAIGSAAFAVAIVASYLTHLSIPFVLDASLVTAYGIALTYAALSVPFIFSGIVVSIALTRFPRAGERALRRRSCRRSARVRHCRSDAAADRCADGGAGDGGRCRSGAWLFATVAGRDVQPGDRGFSVARGRLQLGCAGLAVLLTVVAGAHAAAARHNASWLRLVWVRASTAASTRGALEFVFAHPGHRRPRQMGEAVRVGAQHDAPGGSQGARAAPRHRLLRGDGADTVQRQPG